MNNALENLELLKDKMAGGDERFLEVINGWEQDIKEQSRVQELYKNQVVKKLVNKLKELVDNINTTLRDNKDCNRDELFLCPKECWCFCLLFLDRVFLFEF